MKIEQARVQFIICNTCNANVAGCIESAINPKWVHECNEHIKDNKFRVEMLDDTFDFSQPLSECCKVLRYP